MFSISAVTSLLLPALLLGSAYLFGLAIYRLYFSPISHFPGPRLAALSNWYEFYYDVYLEGKFTLHIQELHKRYGSIIRITPDELHILDPDYYDTLYSRKGRRDKSEYMSTRFGAPTSMLTTTSHEHHKIRKAPLAPMFSRNSIISFQAVIQEKLEKLCQKLDLSRQSGTPITISRAYNSFTGDIISQYCFGKSFDHLESPNFEVNFHESMFAALKSGQVTIHFPWLMTKMQALPHSIVLKLQPVLAELLQFQQDLFRQIAKIQTAVKEGTQEKLEHPTIFIELLNSNLPPDEKSTQRLAHEAQILLGAGLETTSWALSVATFGILNNPEVQASLRRELRDAIPDISAPLDFTRLERLPYLSACAKEGVRLSYGVSSRLPRLAPDEVLRYRDLQDRDWLIPRGTAVSMTPYDILTHDSIFPEPFIFKPERWFGKPKTKNGEPLDRFWFGGGTRACLGQNLAWAELHMTLACMFQRFNMELYETSERDIEMVHDYFTPYPEWDSKGIRVKVTLAEE